MVIRLITQTLVDLRRKNYNINIVLAIVYNSSLDWNNFRPKRLLNTWLCRWRTCTTEGICYVWIWLSGGWRFGDSWQSGILERRSQNTGDVWKRGRNGSWTSSIEHGYREYFWSLDQSQSLSDTWSYHSVARDKIILWQGTRPTGFRPRILPDEENS